MRGRKNERARTRKVIAKIRKQIKENDMKRSKRGKM